MRRTVLALAAWVKTQDNTRKKTYKAVCYNLATAPDDMHVVNYVNESVTYTDDRGTQDGVTYLPSLLAIFAVCNVTRGCTNYECSNLVGGRRKLTIMTRHSARGKFILCQRRG